MCRILLHDALGHLYVKEKVWRKNLKTKHWRFELKPFITKKNIERPVELLWWRMIELETSVARFLVFRHNRVLGLNFLVFYIAVEKFLVHCYSNFIPRYFQQSLYFLVWVNQIVEVRVWLNKFWESSHSRAVITTGSFRRGMPPTIAVLPEKFTHMLDVNTAQ